MTTGPGVSITVLMQTYAAYFQQTGFSVSALWAKRHIGDPGMAGTANPAGDTTRINASACFGTDPVDNGDGTLTITNDAEIGPYLDVTTAETYTYLTFWTDETAGVFAFSGTVTAASVGVHDNWSAPIGDCTATSSYAS